MYTVAIAAYTLVGLGPHSPILTIKTLEDGEKLKCYILVCLRRYFAAPDSHPSNLTGYAVNSTHIHLDWEPPSKDELNGVLRQYRVNVTEDITQKTFQFSTGPDSTEIVVGPFHPDYTYHCSVVAYTVREGPHTSILVIRTHEDGTFIIRKQVSLIIRSVEQHHPVDQEMFLLWYWAHHQRP